MDKGPQRIRREKVEQDQTADYLVSRGLAVANVAGDRVENTVAGRQVGLIDYDPTA